jgi:hypothetical protein
VFHARQPPARGTSIDTAYFLAPEAMFPRRACPRPRLASIIPGNRAAQPGPPVVTMSGAATEGAH